MPYNKKHHFVPRFYLKRFSTDGRSISLYNLKSRKKIPTSNLYNQCYRDYFYGKDQKVERALSVAEGEIARLLLLIDDHRAPPPFGSDHHLNLIFHIVMQNGRTTYAADAVNEMYDKMIKLIFGERMKEKGIDIGQFTIGMKEPGKFSLGASVLGYPLLMDLRCKLLINMTSEDFITSDNPVVLYNQLLSFRKFGSNCGLPEKGLQVFFPIDREKIIVLYDDGAYRVGSDSKEVIEIANLRDVYELNTLQMCSASANIYFTNPAFNAEALHKKGLPYLRTRKVSVSASMQRPTADGNSQLVAASQEDIRTNLAVSVISLRKSAQRWRADFRRQTSQPALVVRNELLLEDFREFEEACKLKQYRPSEFIKFLHDHKKGPGQNPKGN